MTGVLTPPYPAQSIPDVSAGLLAFNAAWKEAKRAGHVAVCIELRRGRWTVKLDALTAPGHEVGQEDAAVLAEAVRTAVNARIATTGTLGPVMYGLEGLAGEQTARTWACAMHAAAYGSPEALRELTAATVPGRGGPHELPAAGRDGTSVAPCMPEGLPG